MKKYALLLLFITFTLHNRVNRRDNHLGLYDSKAMELLFKYNNCENKSLIGQSMVNEDFPGANLKGSLLNHTDFLLTNLDYADLEKANLSNSRLVYSSLVQANLKDTKLIQTNLDYSIMIKANLQRVEGFSASFMQILATEANFSEAKLTGSNFQNSNINLADFRRSDLSETSMNWISAGGTKFQFANLHLAKLVGSSLRFANFNYANLSYANLRNVDAHRTNFRHCNLNHAHLIKAQASRAEFNNANLEWAQCIKADMRGAIFTGANLKNANFSGAILLNAKDFDAGAEGLILCKTVMPDGSINNRDCDIALKAPEAPIQNVPKQKINISQPTQNPQAPAKK